MWLAYAWSTQDSPEGGGKVTQPPPPLGAPGAVAESALIFSIILSFCKDFLSIQILSAF